MKDVDKIILAIESMPEASYASTGTIYTSDVIDLINEALEGKVLVPVEPTKEMLLELTNGYSGKSSVIKLRYKAMLSTIGQDDES